MFSGDSVIHARHCSVGHEIVLCLNLHLILSMVRIVCKAFKKRRVVCRQKLIISALVLLASLCAWNVAEAGPMLAEVSVRYRVLHKYTLLTSHRSNNKDPNQTKTSPKRQQQNNPNQPKTHTCTIPQNQKPSVTSFSCLQTLGVCWTSAVLKAGFLLSYICCSFSQKVPKMARGRKLGIPVSTQQLHIITKDLLEMHIYAYTDLRLYMAVDVPHLKGQFVRKLFVHQNCRCKENTYQLIPPPRKPNNKKPLQSH